LKLGGREGGRRRSGLEWTGGTVGIENSAHGIPMRVLILGMLWTEYMRMLVLRMDDGWLESSTFVARCIDPMSFWNEKSRGSQ